MENKKINLSEKFSLKAGMILVALVVFLIIVYTIANFMNFPVAKPLGKITSNKQNIVEEEKKIVDDSAKKEEVQKNCNEDEKCYSAVAIREGKEEICSYAKSEEMEKNCRDEFNLASAGKQGKIENCDKISSEEKKNSCKDSILENSAMTLLLTATFNELDKIKEDCSKITKQENKQNCLNNYNYQKAERTMAKDRDLQKSEEFCNQIENDKEMLDTCHKNLKLRT